MKKIIFFTFVLLTFNSFSQDESDVLPTDKGQFLVNGGLNFNTSQLDAPNSFIEDASQFNITLGPKAGYFVIDGLAVGLEASFTFARDEFEFIDGERFTNKTTIYTAGPFVRYYLKSGLFTEASIGFGKQNTERDDQFQTDFESETDFFSYELGIGYAIFFNNSVSLEPFLSYQFDRQTQNESESTTKGLNLGVGFTFYF
jgi:outer membrane protein